VDIWVLVTIWIFFLGGIKGEFEKLHFFNQKLYIEDGEKGA
jgi:hypothetical protein